MKKFPLAAACAVAPLVVGCSAQDTPFLVFGQQQTMGLDITANPSEQAASLTLGYKDRNIAIIPVAGKSGGGYELLGATNDDGGDAGDHNDAYSPFGQFHMDTGTKGAVSVGLGKFFATGIATQKLADGFKAKLSK